MPEFVPLSPNCQPLHPLLRSGVGHTEQQPGTVTVLTWRGDVLQEQCRKLVDAAYPTFIAPLESDTAGPCLMMQDAIGRPVVS